MVVRVALLFSIVTICLSAGIISPNIAGGQPFCPPAGCAPAYSCPPAAWGPPVAPFAVCGALVAGCARSCGACLNIPAAIMAGLLAPPLPPLFPRRRFYGCGPAFHGGGYAPPPCPPPCPPPQPQITKCKPTMAAYTPGPGPQPAVWGAGYSDGPMLVGRRRAVYYGGGSYCAPQPPCPPAACGPVACGPRPVLGCFSLCNALLGMPFRLVGGALSVPVGPWAPFADKSASTGKPTFGAYW